jgi:hypothetical protein
MGARKGGWVVWLYRLTLQEDHRRPYPTHGPEIDLAIAAFEDFEFVFDLGVLCVGGLGVIGVARSFFDLI